VAKNFGKPLIATSDAHRLHAFGSHYTSIPRPRELTAENVFETLRQGPARLTSPPSSIAEIASAVYFIFIKHPLKRRRHFAPGSEGTRMEHAHDCAGRS
jgi:hypothetical protein